MVAELAVNEQIKKVVANTGGIPGVYGTKTQLGGIGLYQPLVDFAGAGATTPLTGFGYLISQGVREAVDKQGLLGALTGGLTSAAGGIAGALIFGYLACLVFKGKPKS